MGNQGMKNWKLGTFFVISLILLGGLFSGEVVAHDVGRVSATVDLKMSLIQTPQGRSRSKYHLLPQMKR